MSKSIKINLILGIILFLVGIYSSVILKYPHFYTPFSIGSLLISLGLYRLIFSRSFFDNWKFKDHLLFWILLCAACLIVDQIGLFLNYRHYPYYSGLIDEIIKITLEYAVPLASFAVFVFIGTKLFNQKISIIIISPIILIFTEYINSFSDSWVVTMPLVIWFTIGAWLMSIIPLTIYKYINSK